MAAVNGNGSVLVRLRAEPVSGKYCYSVGYGRQRRRRALRGMEVAEGGAQSQAGRMLLAAFTRLSCGRPVSAALLLLWDTVGLLAMNNHSKTHIMIFIIVLKSYNIAQHGVDDVITVRRLALHCVCRLTTGT